MGSVSRLNGFGESTHHVARCGARAGAGAGAGQPVSTITLDAKPWLRFRDIYAALLPALGAPDWHGPNLDAVYDALVAGHYRVASPFTVTIRNVAVTTGEVRAYLDRLVTVFDDARAQYSVDAMLRLA